MRYSEPILVQSSRDSSLTFNCRDVAIESSQDRLSRSQIKSILILAMGTFLQYFDLMLYVHMAVILNELFFPKTDPYIASLLSAAAFFSTYMLRPFGAIIFGYLGDHYGRKYIVVITTSIMATSCLTMGFLHTYEEIGIAASIIMILCRMFQGLSSLGEITGAELYITEITKPPIQYLAVGIVSVCTLFGGLAALSCSYFALSYALNWRYAFFAGAFIAVIGIYIRYQLKETIEFLDAKRQIQKTLNNIEDEDRREKVSDIIKSTPHYTQAVSKTTSIAYFFLVSAWPAVFYLIYVYCGDIFKHQFGYSGADVIKNNLYIALINGIIVVSLIVLSLKVHPVKILKFRAIIFLVCFPICMYFLALVQTPQELFTMQVILIAVSVCFDPISPVVYKHFPVLKRFTYSGIIKACSKLSINFIIAFGTPILIRHFGYYGMQILLTPIGLCFLWAVLEFQKLEKL